MANRNRMEKLARKQRKKLLKAGNEKKTGRPMAMQPNRDDIGSPSYSVTDGEFPRPDREVPGA